MTEDPRRRRVGGCYRPARAVIHGLSLAALVVVVPLLPGCGGAGHRPVSPLPLRQVAEVPLGGAENRFDYQSIDPLRRRLFVAHLAQEEIDVVDLNGPRQIGTIPDVPEVTGVLAVPALGRLFASAVETNDVRVYDEDSLALLGRTATGEFPDGMSYDPDSGRVYVSDEHGRDLTVLDARTAAIVVRIPLGGDVGNNAYDPVGHQILVDVQSRNELVAVDPASDRVTRRIPLPGCDEGHGLDLDPVTRRAFVTCDVNNRLLVVEVDSGRILQRFDAGRSPDVLAFDPGLRRLYVASESGVVAAFDETPGGQVTKVGQAHLADDAHSVAVDAETHRVYFPIRSLQGHPTLLVMEPA